MKALWSGVPRFRYGYASYGWLRRAIELASWLVAEPAPPVPKDIFVFVWEKWPYALIPPFYPSEQILF